MTVSLRGVIGAAALIAGGVSTSGAWAQAGGGADTTRAVRLSSVVSTADRVGVPLAATAASVSLLDGRELRRRPVHNLADALQQAPGLAFVDFDGLGADPQVMLRGFYGGGEAEYLVLLVDGRPVNAFESGRVNWDIIPFSAVQSIEVVRGGASGAWGDAALGGVVDVRTRRDAGSAIQAAVAGGMHGEVRASFNAYGRPAGRPASLFANLGRTEGYREHAERTAATMGASIGLGEGGTRTVELSSLTDWRRYDEPGPLTGDELAASRRSSSPFYRFDETEELLQRFALDSRRTSGNVAFSGTVAAEYRRLDRVRTLALAPEFADTKNRVLGAARAIAAAQMEMREVFASRDAFLLGADLSYGRASSDYYDFVQGPADAYVAAAPLRGDIVAAGSGTRAMAAAFARYALDLHPRLRISAGARVDWLRDSFDPESPEDAARGSATHAAFSPKAGVSWQYSAAPARDGHVYASVARSFKAPTQDQLFDQRPIPVPFPPFSVTFANSTLDPQYGTSYEAGIYQHASLVPDALDVDITLSAYQMDLRDELDFDIQSLRYANIGRSRHRGIEAGISARAPRSLSFFANYTLQAPETRADENAGKQLKAIPKHFLVAGAVLGGDPGMSLSITATTARGMYLDDANTATLPNWTRWDARASYAVHPFRIFADVRNLLGAEYSTTGFPDPSGSGTVYYYPAAGLTLQFGVSREW